MAAILINDIRNPKSPAQPSFTLKNPYELFSYASFHGGAWRTAFQFGSIGEVAVLVHFVKAFWVYALLLVFAGVFLYKKIM